MKKYILCVLSAIIMFTSSIDLCSVFVLKSLFNFKSEIHVSDVISVQYKIFNQTKQAFSGICDSIVKGLNTVLTSPKTTKTYFNSYNLFLNKQHLDCCLLLTVTLTQNLTSIRLFYNKTTISLFFFGFVFIFILKYLGLLFTFGKIIRLKTYIKAYGI